jgi:LacI family transcriptional regulator
MRLFLYRMRHRGTSFARDRQPEVAILVDGSTGYGRSVFRGVMRYANAQRRWIIHTELRRLISGKPAWPRCDGVIVAGVPMELLPPIRRRTRHFIHCSASADIKYGPVICLDDVEAGRLAAEHLLDCRLEKFGFFGRVGWSASDERCAGFIRAIEARGFSCLVSPAKWRGSYSQTAVDERQMLKWLKSLPRPIGVLAADDSAGVALAAGCLKAGIGVPDEVAILGVNNDDLLCDSAWPPLSSVEADYSRVGYSAAVMLDRLLQGERIPPDQRTVRLHPLGIVRRMSTDVLAVDDPQLAQAVRFIREHACDPCSMDDVLRHIAVGRRWLERQFARKLNRTPHEEILRVQMETAKRLLLQPGLPIEDIALRCGFSSAPSMGRAFLRSFDMTPAAFRRRSIARL